MFGVSIVQQLLLATNSIKCDFVLKPNMNGVLRAYTPLVNGKETVVSVDCERKEIRAIDCPSLEKLKNIEYITISSCRNLEPFSEWIPKLHSLNYLTICRSLDLSTLPEWIGDLTNLTSLSLFNNNLTSLPVSMEKLNNLISLNLDDNCLTEVPDWVLQLKKLKYLYLNNNQIKMPSGVISELRRRGVEVELGYVRSE